MKSTGHELPFARSFRELIVYQKARALQRCVFEETKRFPKEEAYSLTDQIRRSARSIGAQIAEAWAKRDYERHFLSKLTDADAEQMETQHYLEPEIARPIFQKCLEVGRMIGRMKERAAEFCPTSSSVVREEPPDFFAQAPDVFD